MENWQSGNKAAFEEFYRSYHGMVFKCAYFLCSSRVEAEDILQQVFLAAWRFRRSFDPAKANAATWLHKITVNECSKRRKANVIFDSLTDLDFPDIVSRQPEEILVTRQEYEELLKALNNMEEKQRVVVVLRYMNNLSYGEIAEVLGIPLGTVKSRLNLAVKNLRESITVGSKEP